MRKPAFVLKTIFPKREGMPFTVVYTTTVTGKRVSFTGIGVDREAALNEAIRRAAEGGAWTIDIEEYAEEKAERKRNPDRSREPLKAR